MQRPPSNSSSDGSHGAEHGLYPPLNTLKPVCDDVWIVDGPAIGFGPPFLKMPFPTRMTVFRIGGALFIHSPTPLAPGLAAAIDGLGTPAWIVGPNRIHYWWIPDWHAAYPSAEVYLAPRTREQAGDRIGFDHRELDRADGYPWDAEIATLPVAGSYMTEVAFFHRPSRTLVLADLIENFELSRVRSPLLRFLVRLSGTAAPDGQAPRDLRFTFRRQRREVRRAVQTMIGWNPERVILAHGEWFEQDGAQRLRRAFRWLLD